MSTPKVHAAVQHLPEHDLNYLLVMTVQPYTEGALAHVIDAMARNAIAEVLPGHPLEGTTVEDYHVAAGEWCA